MKILNKAKIVLFAYLLLGGIANIVVYQTLASLTPIYATKTVKITDSSSNAKTNNSAPPQPRPSSCYTVINYPNGTKATVFTTVDPRTLPVNATEAVFVTVYSSMNMGASISGSASEPFIIPPLWLVLEQLYDVIRYTEQISLLLLLGFASALELLNKFKFPKLPPIINR